MAMPLPCAACAGETGRSTNTQYQSKMGKGDDWTDDELQECLVAYLRMYQDEVLGRKFIKVQVYRELSAKTGRSVKSIERRFGNISHIMNLRGTSRIS